MRLMATGVDTVVPRESDHGCLAHPTMKEHSHLFAPLPIVGQFSLMLSSAHVEMVEPGREGEVPEGERALKEQGI